MPSPAPGTHHSRCSINHVYSAPSCAQHLAPVSSGDQSIVTEFDSTINGILICTQQSLSSSVNIPTCNDVILESLQWNIPKMEQFYFRFIRLDSKEMKDVHYVTYEDSVEQNLMALVLTKERLNEFIKTGEVKEQSEIFEEFDITMSVIDSLLIRSTDSEGKIHISWGSQRVTS